LDQFYQQASQVSAKTYQERLLGTGLPRTPEFAQRLAQRASRGALRGYVLRLDGQPAAYIYGDLEEGVLAYDYVGFDPAFRPDSPGIVLQYLALQDLFADPAVRVFDFTEGEGQHKETFATASRPCADIFFFRGHPDLALLVATHHGLARLWQGLSSLAQRLGLKKALKDRLRA
ncbi:MAG: GNAT family N-acetyltransferase, partial [Polyangia bacterium]